MSRKTFINESSKSVTGTFMLDDLLFIQTLSGSINITIVPQPALTAGTPAQIRLRTVSGSIKVTMAPFLDDDLSTPVPERIFHSSLTSYSGSISATLLHSGTITASLHPLDRLTSSQVNIFNVSGFTSVTVNPHVFHPWTPFRTLSANLYGYSGAFKVRLPLTWEGEVVVPRLSDGRGPGVMYAWEGLRVVRGGVGFGAVKGDGGGGQLNVFGKQMSVGLVGVRVPEEDGDYEGDDDWTDVEDEDGAWKAA